MTQFEFEQLMADTTKRISGDISWSEDEDHSPTEEFRVDVASQTGYTLFMNGAYLMLTPFEQITEKIGELFICSTLNEYIRIRTPFLYPDGDVIDFFYKEEGESATLTDLGETLRWLRMQTVTQRKSAKQRQLINDICLNHGIEFYRGMLMVRFKKSEDIAQAIIRLSQAALRVSDLWFTFRNRASESATDEVEDLFRDRQITYQRSPRVTGRSGRVWRPDFHTRLPERSTLVTVLR